MSIRRFFLNENMSTKKAIKESTDSIEVFDNSLDEEYDILVEGPFDIFKKKKLSPEQEAYATALRAGVDKVDFVQVNPKAGLEKEFFDVVGSVQHQQYQLWSNCYMVVCPKPLEDGKLSEVQAAPAGNFATALSKAKDLAVKAYNSDQVKAYNKVFGDLPMPILFCVKPDDAASPEFKATLQKYANMPKIKDLGSSFGTSLADAMIVGAYFMNAKEGQEFRMPIRVREVFANGLGEFTKIKGVARDTKTGEAAE